MVHRPGGGTRANGPLTAWTATGQAGGFLPDEAPSFRKMVAQADSSLFKTLSATLTMSSEARVHSPLPSSITSVLDPTLSTSQLVTIETFSPALCFLAHTNNLLLFLYYVSTLTFCINVLHRFIVNGCVLSPMFENKRRYNTQANFENTSIQVSKYLFLSLYFNSAERSASSACHRLSIPMVNVFLRLKVNLTGLCKVYAFLSCSEVLTSLVLNFPSRCRLNVCTLLKLPGCLGSKYESISIAVPKQSLVF